MPVIKSIKGDDFNSVLRTFLQKLLEQGAVSDLLVPVIADSGENIVPTLVHNKTALDGKELVAPVINGSSATHLVQLTEEKNERKLGAVLRPCEERAVVELLKLKQIEPENLLRIGTGCMGTISIRNYSKLIRSGKTGMEIFGQVMKDRYAPVEGDIGIRESCKLCTYRMPTVSDIMVGFNAPEKGAELLAISRSDKGEEVLNSLDLPDGKPPEGMEEGLKKLGEQTEKFINEISPELDAMTATPEELEKALDLCIRCYNCMSMCPICYCKECFFQSAPVVPSPAQYQKRAAKKGSLNIPSDKMLFQLGRMNHMITSCVGCGQCLEACPNDVDYLRQFPYMAKIIQKVFDYEAGRDTEEPLPLADFKEDELYPK